MKPQRADEDAEVTGGDAWATVGSATVNSGATAGRDACATLSSATLRNEATTGRDACATVSSAALRGIVRQSWCSRVVAAAFVCAAMAALFVAPSARADEDREQGNLWPGESHAFLGVTVTWEVSGKTGSEGTSPEGARMDDLAKERDGNQVQSMMPLPVEGGVGAPGMPAGSAMQGSAPGMEPGMPGTVNGLPEAPSVSGMPVGPAMEGSGPGMAPGMMMDGGMGMTGMGTGPGAPVRAPQGTLRFKGPKTEVGGLAISHGGDLSRSLGFFIDGVFFKWQARADATGSFLLEIMAESWPVESDIAGPPTSDLTRYVSNDCPIRLNNWTLTVSKEPVSLPDGSRHLELRAVNADGGEEIAFPLVQNAMRKAGRYTIQVRNVWKETRTARLKIDAAADLTIKGRLAWTQESEMKIAPGDTLKDFLDSFGKKCGFTVEWIPFPDHSESVRLSQEARSDKGWNIGVDSIASLVERLAKQDVFIGSDGKNFVRSRFEWKDDTHLQVIPVDFDKYLAAREKEEKKLAASKKADEERDAEMPRFEELFADTYGLQTKVYKLDTLTPVTAKALIDKDLRKYFLGQYFLNYQSEKGVLEPGGIVAKGSASHDPSFALLEKGEYHTIGRMSSSTPLEEYTGVLILGSVVEQAIADDKANALIVTAIPATHEKIAALLDKMESLASDKSPKGPPPAPYRISAVLLQGVQAGDASTGPVSVPPVRAQDVSGTVEEIGAKVGDIVSQADVLVRLDPATVVTERINAITQEIALVTKQQEAGIISMQDRNREMEAIENRIQSQRQRIEANHQNEIRAPRGRFRVASILVKEGDRVAWGQEVATLEPFPPLSPKSENADKSASAKPPRPTPSLLDRYGLTSADLKAFDIGYVFEMGKGIVSLVPEKGDIGVARVALDGDYTLTLTFLDERSPYLVVKGALQKGKQKEGDVVIENTLYLEADKPTLLGVTNLREALILIVRRFDDQETPSDPAAKSPKSGTESAAGNE